MTPLEDLSPEARAKLGSYAVLGHRMRRAMGLAVPAEEVLVELLVCLEELMAREGLPRDEIYNLARAGVGWAPRATDPAQPARPRRAEQAAPDVRATDPPQRPAFVPGDWVRVVKPGTFPDGAEGLVLRVDAARDQVDVRPRGGKGTTALFPSRDLHLVARRQQPSPAPGVGDSVIVTESGSAYYGRKGIVSMTSPDAQGALYVELRRGKACEWFKPTDLVLYNTAAELAGADKGVL